LLVIGFTESAVASAIEGMSGELIPLTRLPEFTNVEAILKAYDIREKERMTTEPIHSIYTRIALKNNN
jgi:hypothetical protein